MDAFQTYGTFLALKRHFTSETYDYFRYNGKVKTNYDKFLQRKDKYHFHKLGKHEDLENFILSNLIVDSDIWVTDMNQSKAEENYLKWKKRIQSLTYNFRTEIGKFPESTTFDDLLVVKDGQHPMMLQLYLRGSVSLETLMIINDLTSVFKHWNSSITDEIIWPSLYMRMKKYRTFLKLEGKSSEYRKIIVDKYTH